MEIQAQQRRASMLKMMGTLQTACQTRCEQHDRKRDAATKMQATFRGYWQRKQASSLKELTNMSSGAQDQLPPLAKEDNHRLFARAGAAQKNGHRAAAEIGRHGQTTYQTKKHQSSFRTTVSVSRS